MAYVVRALYFVSSDPQGPSLPVCGGPGISIAVSFQFRKTFITPLPPHDSPPRWQMSPPSDRADYNDQRQQVNGQHGAGLVDKEMPKLLSGNHVSVSPLGSGSPGEHSARGQESMHAHGPLQDLMACGLRKLATGHGRDPECCRGEGLLSPAVRCAGYDENFRHEPSTRSWPTCCWKIAYAA